MEMSTGSVIYENNADEKAYPASVTKIENEAFMDCNANLKLFFLGDAPKFEENAFEGADVIVHYPKSENWLDVHGKQYGGTARYVAYRLSDGLAIADTGSALSYPVGGVNEYSQQLQKWIEECGYAEIFETWLEKYSYEDMLNMTINIPVADETGQAYLVEGNSTVKEVMAYIMFSEMSSVFHFCKFYHSPLGKKNVL